MGFFRICGFTCGGRKQICGGRKQICGRKRFLWFFFRICGFICGCRKQICGTRKQFLWGFLEFAVFFGFSTVCGSRTPMCKNP
jgi:hypothetical protein